MRLTRRVLDGVCALAATTAAWTSWAVGLLLAGVLPQHAAAQSSPAPLHVVFVNGIRNTPEQALNSMLRLRARLAETPTRGPTQRRPFIVADHVYNPTGAGSVETNTAAGFIEDSKEVFLLKTAEECFRADFAAIAVPHTEPTRATNLAAANRVKDYLDNMVPGTGGLECGNNGLAALRLVSNEDMEGFKQAALAIVERVKRFDATIVVAHSQGNLAAHLAYAALVAEMGSAANQRMRVVNVANPSALSAHGLDVTLATDRVVNAVKSTPLALSLPTLGGSLWRSTPDCRVPDVCDFSIGTALLAGGSGYGDLLRHSFIDTYLSTFHAELGIGAQASGIAYTPGHTAFADRLVDTVYAAAQSLRPLGAGTPDLAVDRFSFSPASVAAGGALSVQLTVRNDGAGTAPGSVAMLYVNGSAASPAGALVSLPIMVPQMAAGSRMTLPDVNVVAPAAVGSYRVWVALDAQGTAGQTTAGRANDIAMAAGVLSVTAQSQPSPSTSGPDLVIQSLSHGAAAVVPGGTFALTFNVTNTGRQAASASRVVVRINSSQSSPVGTDLGSVEVPALAAGASVSRTLSVRAPSTAGVYRLWVLADSTSTAGQNSSAAANDAYLAPQVLTVAEPAEAADLVPEAISFQPANVTQGHLMAVSFTIRNRGPLPSRSTRAAVRLNPAGAGASGADRALLLVPGLPSGGSRSFTVTLTAAVPIGAYQVWVHADSAGVAGQTTAAAIANDIVGAPQALTVAARSPASGVGAEGVYSGTVAGPTTQAFRMLVLETGEFWAPYGFMSGGRLVVTGFIQGLAAFAGGSISATDVRDFGVLPAAVGTVTGSYDPAAGTISGTLSSTAGTFNLNGGPVTDAVYEYNQPARPAEAAGAWRLTTSTGDTIVAQVQADGRFDVTSNAGCRLSGRIVPSPSNKNVFDTTVNFGPAPCVLPNQTARGVALIAMERDGLQNLTMGLVNASRTAGLFATGFR